MPHRSPLHCTALVLATIALATLCAAGSPAAGATAPPRTLRVDYLHSGNAREEHFAIERVVLEPLPWPGDPAKTIDDTNLGKYFFEVIDRASHRVLYSRGFASIYGEWETTGEAASSDGAFGESLRFPAPAAPVQVSIKKRDPRTQAFREVWTQVVDPKDPTLDPSAPPPAGPRLVLQDSGDLGKKLDLLVLGDGYTA
ncbi:MAG TPA: peptidase M64 N-terminal domain-containing protein, partial [Thermoanaerobaculia bacterium]|nr:peptidase M64 N-terminal domain-containing protein [Thermoanaerobaculia bacterium]